MGVSFGRMGKSDAATISGKIRGSGFLRMHGDMDYWTAIHPQTNVSASGRGSFVGQVEAGLWVTDRAYDSVKALRDTVQNSGISLKADGWFREPFEKVVESWHIAGQPDEQVLKIVGGVYDRVYRLVQEAAVDLAKRNLLSVNDEIYRILERSPSLASGITRITRSMVASSVVKQPKIRRDYLEQIYSNRMFVKNNASDAGHGDMVLTFRFPALNYVRRIAAPEVPVEGIWQFAGREPGTSVEQFIEEILKIRARPLIFCGGLRPSRGSIPEHVAAFSAHPFTGRGFYPRSHFLLEDLDILRRHYDLEIESVIAGVKTRPSGVGQLLDALVSAAGGEHLAGMSWSANVAAENIFVSASRDVSHFNITAAHNVESVWLAARDKAAMFPAIDQLVSVGMSLSSAQAGIIEMRCPQDPEMLTVGVSAAWEAGLMLSMGSVAKLEAMGVHVPHEREHFGGSEADYQYAMLSHRKMRNALWQVDRILDLRKEQRAPAFRSMFAGS